MPFQALKEFIALTAKPASRWRVVAMIALMLLPLPLYIGLPLLVVACLMPYLLKYFDAKHEADQTGD